MVIRGAVFLISLDSSIAVSLVAIERAILLSYAAHFKDLLD
jgi:hypothetical protein